MLKLKFLALIFYIIFLSFNVFAMELPATSQWSTNEKLATMLMFGFREQQIVDETEVLKGVDNTLPFNFILFDRDVTQNSARNIISPKQLKALTQSLRNKIKKSFFIAVDQEGGQVRRLKPQKGFYDLPSAQKMGHENVNSTLENAESLGRELHGLGINVDLAPVVDVDSNPYNPVIGRLGRAFNSDPAIVAAHALAFGQGLARNKIIPVLKHFPGQGCADKDTHTEPVNISQCWNADVDLLPYAEIFSAGWPGMVMIGHLSLSGLDPNFPASLSDNIINGLLRHGMNWQGVVISDDLQMKAISAERSLREIIELALNAGNDILVFGNNLDWDEKLAEKVWKILQDMIASGKLTEERIDESWRRIEALKNAFGMNLPVAEDSGESIAN